MNGYLLDTNICIFLFRGSTKIEQRLNKIGYEHCFISDVTVAELRYGAYNSDFVEENLKMIDDFLKNIKVIPFASCIDDYAREKARLKSIGKMIEDFDLLIGCTAKAADLVMVSNNVRHFSRINDIEIEDWIE